MIRLLAASIIFFASITATCQAENITFQKYYRSNGVEITKAQYDAEVAGI